MPRQSTCSVSDCFRDVYAVGFCNMHFLRWKRHGTTDKFDRGKPPAERFWPKVDKNGPIPAFAPGLGPCWIWTASLDAHGYGQFYMPGRGPAKAHRFAYEDLVGPIPRGLEPDHLCRVRHCVRPTHLEPVTRRENYMRGLGPSSHVKNTHCKRGHEFTLDNTRVLPDGERVCRHCKADWVRAKRLASK